MIHEQAKNMNNMALIHNGCVLGLHPSLDGSIPSGAT